MVERIRRSTVVYDIQVSKNQNFFANGILVHNCLIADDPQNGPEETESKVQRDRSWRAFGAAATTRLTPGGSVILVMTRWHQDDIAGRALEQGDWHVVNLPALAEENDALGRKTGEPLWPAETLPDGRIVGFGIDELAERRKMLPSDYYWWAEYQQRPIPPGGAVFKQEWFRYFWQDANYYYLKHPLGDISVNRKHCWRFSIADTASTTKTHSDYTAVGTFAVTPDRHLLLLDMVRVKMETPDVEALIRRVIQQWQPKFVGIEAKMTGLAVVQSLKRAGLPVREVVPRKGDAKFEPDKLVRSIEAQTLYQNSRIWHAEGAHWLGDFEAEMLSFSPDMAHAHDDQVDVVSYAAKELQYVVPASRPRPFALGGVR